MKALILAAGLGSRLRILSDSKPLTRVAGVPLIEHAIRGAAAGGIADFVVVTGHCADAVEAFLAASASRLGVRIETVRVEDWSRPNGLSVVAGAGRIDGDFLLLMCDHLFDPEIVARLLRRDRPSSLCLAVDRDLANPETDLADATKVLTDGRDGIEAIGKGLERYDAIDTGIFRATPRLREAILAAVEAGRAGSLSDGVQRLAESGEASVMDIGGAWWIDVDDPRSHALAEAHLQRDNSLRGNAA